MKKQIIFLLFLVVCSTTIKAQLKVDSIGRIRLNNSVVVGSGTDFSVNAGLQTYKDVGNNSYYGIHSQVDVTTLLSLRNKYVAVLGLTNSTENIVPPFPHLNSSNISLNSFIAGVVGLAPKGVAVYGGTSSSLPSSQIGTYAGYFSGDVGISGLLSTSLITVTSDERLKTNIFSIRSRESSLIYNLNPVSYKLNQEDTLHYKFNNQSKAIDDIHYGLIAQEVQKTYPNLVYDNNGYLSINYIELIPLLISTIQEQNLRITELEELYDGKMQMKSNKKIITVR